MTSTGPVNGSARGPVPLRVLIVGAGLGGLTAALALRQAGHDVTLVESSSFSQEIGAGLHIAPYSNGALKRLGIDLTNDKSIGATENTGCSIWPPFAPKSIYISYAEEHKRWQHRRVMVHRAHLHAALREKALSGEGGGKPCRLRLSSRVLSVDPEQGEVLLAGGERVYGDIVLGADGVHSQCRKALEGGRGYVPFECGISAFRFTVPMQALRDDPVTSKLLGPDGTLLAALTVGGIKRLICYPIADNTLMNFVFLHAGIESQICDKTQEANMKKLLLEIGRDFTPAFRAVLEKVQEENIRLWPLLDLPVLPTWVNGKMALLGDAAHPFLPHRAEGASQAIEDAISLGTLFHFGTPAEAVPERLALYEECRKERATNIQEASRIFSQSQEYQKKKGFNPHEFDNYSYSHDEYHHSLHALRLLLKSKRPDIRMRMPVSFGPAPGPCQPGNTIHGVLGSKPADFAPRQIVQTIRFATSKTYLQNYFPTPAFSFDKADTVVQASLVCTSFRDLAWLGGHGYERVGLHIHGVQYRQASGEVVKGAYVPVLLENSVDSLVAGREERGAPVVGCDINVTESGGSKTITLSWKGTVVGEIRLDGITGTSTAGVAPPNPDEEGLLTFRFIPAVGKPGGKPDAAYTVFEPYREVAPEKAATNGVDRGQGEAKSTNNGEAHQNGQYRADGVPDTTNGEHHVHVKSEASAGYDTKYASQATFEFTAGNWQSIPTLHHIIKNLQGIPVFGILEAKIETIQGGLDEFSLAGRLD